MGVPFCSDLLGAFTRRLSGLGLSFFHYYIQQPMQPTRPKHDAGQQEVGTELQRRGFHLGPSTKLGIRFLPVCSGASVRIASWG